MLNTVVYRYSTTMAQMCLILTDIETGVQEWLQGSNFCWPWSSIYQMDGEEKGIPGKEKVWTKTQKQDRITREIP